MSSSVVLLLITAVALLALIVAIIAFIIGVNRKKESVQIKDIITQISDEEKIADDIKMLPIERFFVDKFRIEGNKAKPLIYALRVLFIALVIVSYILFQMAGVTICAAIIIFMIMNSRLKNEIEKSGINRIQKTVSFMDAFVPALSSGQSAKQAFQSYVNSLPEDDPDAGLLANYIQAKDEDDYTYVVPAVIRDITSIYEVAVYNEEKGVNNYLYVIEEAKQDLFKKSEYYNEYRNRVGEVLKPTEAAYYVGVPAIIILLFPTLGSFWGTPAGIIVCILLLILFFIFKYFINKLNINTIYKIL